MFVLSSALEVFNREMTRILDGCAGIDVHMDILVVGANKEEHDRHLKVVLNRIKQAGMTLNKKCEFEKGLVIFLGFRIDKEGIHAGDHMQGLVDFPTLEICEGPKFSGAS